MLKNISIAEAQDIAFNLFLAFKDICDKNGLCYYLSGGTLLGAVRHKGFIPWDDDMDVMMPRPDYERLLSLNLELPETLQLFSCETDSQYNYPFAKLCDMRYKVHFGHHLEERSIGMYIDIFPIEGLPDGKFGKKFYFKWMSLLNIMRNAALRSAFLPDEKFIFIKKLMLPYARKRGANHYAQKMNSFAKKFPLGKTNHSGVTMITHYGSREWMRREVFEQGEPLLFRDQLCSAPKGWDEYLRNLYGDYMQLPPEDKRCTDHGNFTIEVR